jgi:hypothetical protein
MASKKTTTSKATSKKAPSKEATAQSENAVTTTGGDSNNELILQGIDLAADCGAGLEGTDQDSFAIPIIRILQPMSPQVNEADGEYIEGARPGMLLNSATNELIDGKEGCHFLPCAFQRRYLRWAPRGGDGSGFRGEFFPEDINQMRKDDELFEVEGHLYFPNEDGKFVSDKKNDKCVDTRSHFGILITDKGASQVLFPLASTQVKKSKRLMSILTSARVMVNGKSVAPPTWINKIKVQTTAESNDQGNWFGVKFEPDGFINDAGLYQSGKEFHDLVVAGEAKVNYAAGDDLAEDDETSDNF